MSRRNAPGENSHLNLSVARWPVAVGSAFLVAICLLWLMHYLIASADAAIVDEPTIVGTLDFIREKPAIEEFPPDQPITPPPEPLPPPPITELDPDAIGEVSLNFTTQPVKFKPKPRINLNFAAVTEGDYLPFVLIQPIYPTRAIERGLEGACVIQFTVTKAGAVRDPSVVESDCSHSVFRRPSIKAALQFKYKPRVVDGEAIEVRGVQKRFTYKLEG